ncbi:MAG: hypothetical protein QOG00_2724 [Pyrinomonadaceae bacterium]|jgi:hypothetical protein|nr:hypothetical protein [Pyrinomonadaceae bacterium]MDQ1612793.1 hypothetical protein [Pyrinomonadaceae bacterium]MDX6271954.1 hypothetical protein [Acidobacteriota bacterium]
MPDDNLLATLEQSLRQTRATRNRLAARLADLELEAEKLRTELGEMDAIATQTEAAMFRILSSVLNSVPSHQSQQQQQQQSPSDAEIEVALRRDDFQGRGNNRPHPTYQTVPRSTLPPVRTDVEVTSERFLDRTIPQATALLLREAGAPLHVNEIYNRLLEGGFNFTGHNPTISIAVSLNRNGRFRKVAPGTFDLTIRDAAQVS